MNYDPIINSKLNNFKTNYNLTALDNNEAFEMFVNNLVLRSYQPETFSVINDLFDQICVGGSDDMGIDGLAVRINGLFVGTKEDVDSILNKSSKISVEFLLIQSKFRKNLDSGEFGKFMDGIVDFLGDKHYEPHNQKIENWIDLKNYICSEEVLIHWEQTPKIKIYYVYTGEWKDDKHIIGKFNNTQSEIGSIGLYNDVLIKYIDASRLKKLCDDVENQFKQVITIIDSLELNEAPSVESSRVLLCSANDFISLLVDEDEELRRTLFKDNVRDYQGSTEINNDIYNTIKEDPYNFCLLNNGITIVCKSAIPGNRKISIENPQIVNGCQTCSSLYKAYREGADLSGITLIIKLIATENSNVTNAVVKGTNRQNIVYDEAFEITRKFHKDFEEFVDVIQEKIAPSEKIYYERRANQYINNPSIKIFQKANFKILIQSFISVMLQLPHEGFVHDSYLLARYRNRIFIEGQSFLPYYLAISLYLKVDRLFKSKYEKYKYITTYKYQILCLMVERIAGVVPDINHTKKIDDYCHKILVVIQNDERLETYLDDAVSFFYEVKNSWVADKGEQFKFAIKDNALFTKYMFTRLRGGDTNKIFDEEPAHELRGRVVTVKKDRNGMYYGYIKGYPYDVFIHEDDNPKIKFHDLTGNDVVYIITETTKYNTPRGKIKYIVN